MKSTSSEHLYLSEFPLTAKGRPIITSFEVTPLAHA